MTHTLTAAMRRANRLMRRPKLGKAVRSVQSAVAGAMVKTALAPLATLKPKAVKRLKPAASKPGSTLGLVLQQLRQAQTLFRVTPAGPSGKAPTIPEGAQYLSGTHRMAAGSRSYKIYLPARQSTRAKGLILMLHGCSQ